MRCLLDTNALIWFIEGNAQLSTHARALIEDEENELLVSIASLWEMAIKFSIGKSNLSQPFEKLSLISLRSIASRFWASR